MKVKDEQLPLIDTRPEEPSVLKPGEKVKPFRNKRPRCKVKSEVQK